MEETAGTIEEAGQFTEEAQEQNKEPIFFVDASGDADIDQVSHDLPAAQKIFFSILKKRM